MNRRSKNVISGDQIEASQILAAKFSRIDRLAWALAAISDAEDENYEGHLTRISGWHSWIEGLKLPFHMEDGSPARQSGGVPVTGMDLRELAYLCVQDVRRAARRDKMTWPDRYDDDHVHWYNETLDAEHWFLLPLVSPEHAAMLLCQHNPNEAGVSYESTLGVTNEEVGRSELEKLRRMFDAVSATDPKNRTLLDWVRLAEEKKLSFHSWIKNYIRLVWGDAVLDKEVDESRKLPGISSADDAASSGLEQIDDLFGEIERVERGIEYWKTRDDTAASDAKIVQSELAPLQVRYELLLARKRALRGDDPYSLHPVVDMDAAPHTLSSSGPCSTFPNLVDGLSTAQIAGIFDGLHYSAENWPKRLSDTKWLQSALLARGTPGGGTGLWDPAILATLIHGRKRGEEKKKMLATLNRKFKTNQELAPWRSAWDEHYAIFTDTDDDR